MTLRKGTPGKGGGLRPDSFSYTPVGYGLKNSFSAYVAGETYWCEEAHEHKPPAFRGSQPCLHWITNGELRCERCRKQPAVLTLGWLPLWREQDHSPIMVILHQDVFDLVRDLRFGQSVTVGRVSEKSSVYVRPTEPVSWFKSANPFRQRAVDITKDLLTMWRLEDLNEWLRRKPREAAAPEPLEYTPEQLDRAKQQFSAPWRAAALRYGAVKDDGADAVDTALKGALERTKKAEKNGKHTNEGEGS